MRAAPTILSRRIHVSTRPALKAASAAASSAPDLSEQVSAAATIAGPASGTTRPLPSICYGARIRKSPYFDATVADGCDNFTVYNHMLMPLWFSGMESEYWNLKENVCMWDVSAERQVELKGPDAGKLAQLLSSRNLSKQKPGQALYALMTDENGLVVNDPVLMKLSEEQYWFSIADSDVLLWAKMAAVANKFDVQVTEPDVSPLAIQGPKSVDLCKELFGDWVGDLKYFWFREATLDGIPMIVCKSGWSPEVGYELFLQDGSQGARLWEIVRETGKKYGIMPGAPNHPRRIESGMLSFGTDIPQTMNALEVGLPRKFMNPHCEPEFLGKKALQQIQEDGAKHRVIGLAFDTTEASAIKAPFTRSWPVVCPKQDVKVGNLTSIAFSPLLQKHIAVAHVETRPVDFSAPETELIVQTPDGNMPVQTSKFPFAGTA